MIGPGATLGPFELGEPIGSGGFATVYAAEDTRFGDHVAVKVLADNHALNPDVRGRFLGEAQNLRRIRSEHLIRVLDVGETDTGRPYFVLEHAAGGDLRGRVERLRAEGWRPEPDDVVLVVDALAAALDAIHSEKIVHRDVTPANLLITTVSSRRPGEGRRLLAPDERLVLADLGYAKDLALHSGLTAGGGTHGFGAPEQRQGIGRVDHRADIYAASAVVGWLLFGEAPVDAGDVAVRPVPPGFNPVLAEQLTHGLAERPEDRHAGARAWQGAIASALSPEPAPSPAPTDRPPTRSSRRIWVATAAVIALAVLGAWLVGSLTDAPATERLSDGRIATAAVIDDQTFRLIAPAELEVGTDSLIEVEAPPDATWILVGPDNQHYPNGTALAIRPTTAGSALVSLIVTDPGRPAKTIEHRIVVNG